VKRVLARDNHDVDDGWLCDKGRFGFQMLASPDRLSVPQVRDAGALREASWEESLERAAAGLGAARGKVAAIVGGAATNEEGYLLQRIVRRALGSADVDSRPGRGPSHDLLVELSRPERAAAVADLDEADAILVLDCDPLHEMPILDLRIRKAVRQGGAKLVVASARPTALDGGAEEVVRFAPGGAASFTLDGDAGAALRSAGRVVLVHGERVASGDDADAGAAALLTLAGELKLEADGSGLIEVPSGANGRGLREVGCLPGVGPGLDEARKGRSADEIKAALESGELEALILWEADLIRDLSDPKGWHAALGAANFVLSVSMFGNGSGSHADIVLPAEGYAEKEGTVTHPDGRLQRLRRNVPLPEGMIPGWRFLAAVATELGSDINAESPADIFEALSNEVPFYDTLTYEEIGGTGLRWGDRDPGQSWTPGRPEGAAGGRPTPPGVPPSAPSDRPSADGLLLGTYRDLWATDVTKRNPALRFLMPKQKLELAAKDAETLELANGDEVTVAVNGSSLHATIAIRERMRQGAAFLIEGTDQANGNVLTNGVSQRIQVTKR
jgi:NADH-quinone oxidoreductase subunit G